MSGGEFAPLIYVDLIADKPLTLEEYEVRYLDELGDIGPVQERYRRYIDRFQPWRITIKSGDNQEPLFRSTESYFNKADAEHAAQLAFGAGSNVYLRQAEHGNQVLRMAVR